METMMAKLMTDELLQAHVKSGRPSKYPRDADAQFEYPIRRPAPRITCADSFTVSVQASCTHYCEPQNNTGPYTHFELGYPSMVEPDILPYVDDEANPTSTVYSRVPAAKVIDLINRHGGYVND
jgi:hypothetical protein